MDKWNNVLNHWENGKIPKIPINLKKPFIWRTNRINKNEDLVYKEEFIEDKRLFNIKQDYSPFLKKPCQLLHKKHSHEKYIISSLNLNKDTILIIPKPRKNKTFTTLFHFMNEASQLQQKKLWKKVALETKKFLKNHDNVWISTHGLGVSYLHIRISAKPKYYENSKLKYFD